MATGKIKVNFKMPTPSAADRMYAKHQIIRKAAGLPDVDNNPDRPDAGKYSSGSSKPVKRVTPVATPSVNESDITVVKKGTGIKKKISDISYDVFKSHGFVKEEEVVVEMDNRTSRDDSIERRKYSPEGMARQDKEQQKRLKDISAEMRKKLRLPEPKKVEESFRIGGMASGGRGNIHMYDRNPGPRDDESDHVPYVPKTDKDKKLAAALTDVGKTFPKSITARPKYPKLKEAKDSQEYDYEGDMAKSDLRSIIHNAQTLHDMIDDDTNLAEWCQSKITLAEDYISTVTNYMRSEMKEEVQLDEKKKLPGLWANIHAKRKRGEPPAKPGDKDYPKTLNIEGVQDDPKADQMTTDDTKFPKKSRKASIVKAAAKKMPSEDQFQDKPVLDSQVAQQTNK
jgi:hypothetical protein